MKLDDLTLEVWNKATECNCEDQDCYKNHKLCGLCDGTIIYGAHKSEQPNSKYAWDIDHIIPLSKGGTDAIENLHAVHVTCNQNKDDNY